MGEGIALPEGIRFLNTPINVSGAKFELQPDTWYPNIHTGHNC
jgi:hypothetical protein